MHSTASSIKEFTNQAKRKQDEFFLPKKAAHTSTAKPPPPTYMNDNHDAFLYHHWNNKNKINNGTNKPTTAPWNTASAPIEIHVKDDSSVTPTLETLCTLDTWSLDPSNNDTDAILNITIWNQPIVQYWMPTRSTMYTRNQSREHPSTAVQYVLIGVYYNKLLNPQKLPCLFYLFTSISCVVLSCFNLLADFFTMVKIDDRYPEWND